MAYYKTGVQLQKEITEKIKSSKDKTVSTQKVKTPEKTKEANVIDNAIKTSTGKDVEQLNFNQASQIDRDENITLSQSDLLELGITNLVGGEASIGEVKKILERRPLIPALQASVFNLNYKIEPVPIPPVNNIYSLQTKRVDLFNKFVPDKEFRSDVDLPYQGTTYHIKNYMMQEATSIDIVITGDTNTPYSLVIKDNTNNTYYNETVDLFRTGFHEISGLIGDQEDIAGNIKSEIEVQIPMNIYEIEYYVYLIQDGIVQLAGGLPTAQIPWVLNQLPDVTTTLKLSSDNNFGAIGGTQVINHKPGTFLSSSKTSSAAVGRDGESDDARIQQIQPNSFGDSNFTLTVAAGTGEYDTISVEDGIEGGLVTIGSISSDGTDTYTATQILEHDLVISVVGNVGRVTGTMLLGKSGIRDSVINISTEDLFNLAAN